MEQPSSREELSRAENRVALDKSGGCLSKVWNLEAAGKDILLPFPLEARPSLGVSQNDGSSTWTWMLAVRLPALFCQHCFAGRIVSVDSPVRRLCVDFSVTLRLKNCSSG